MYVLSYIYIYIYNIAHINLDKVLILSWSVMLGIQFLYQLCTYMAMTIGLKSNVYMAKSLHYHEYLERYNIVHCTRILTFDLEGQGHTY